MAEQVAEGIHLLGRYSPYQCGAWVFEHGGEAALLEMPPCQAGRPKPWDDAYAFVSTHHLRVRWLLLTHAHIDHSFGYVSFRKTFTKARTLVHRSFLDWYRRSAFDDVFYAPIRELSLGGEPLILLHAPKHSPQDCLVFFRGAVCTGDWSLGPFPDGNPLVPPEVKVRSIDVVLRFLEERHYHVHMAFSAHANEFRRNVDFVALLHETRAYWERFPPGEWRKRLRRWRRWIERC